MNKQELHAALVAAGHKDAAAKLEDSPSPDFSYYNSLLGILPIEEEEDEPTESDETAE